jgi:hypothetical protein
MKKILSLLVLLFPLAGCIHHVEQALEKPFVGVFSPELQNISLESNTPVPPEKAVILVGTKYTFFFDPLIGPSGYHHIPGEFRFLKDKILTGSTDSQINIWTTHSNDTDNFYYDIYVVDPGEYHLSKMKFKQHRSMTTVEAQHHGLNQSTNLPEYLSFKVAAGDVAYIGNIEAKFHTPLAGFDLKRSVAYKQFLNIQVTDNYEGAVAYLKKLHPKFTSKVAKKLAIRGPHTAYSMAMKVKEALLLKKEAEK